MIGCSGNKVTIPEADIPDIPPSTRTTPGDEGSKADGFVPTPPR